MRLLKLSFYFPIKLPFYSWVCAKQGLSRSHLRGDYQRWLWNIQCLCISPVNWKSAASGTFWAALGGVASSQGRWSFSAAQYYRETPKVLGPVWASQHKTHGQMGISPAKGGKRAQNTQHVRSNQNSWAWSAWKGDCGESHPCEQTLGSRASL